MRMMRDSPPEEARECPAPYASSSKRRWPRAARCHAVHEPNTPAPTTTVSKICMAMLILGQEFGPVRQMIQGFRVGGIQMQRGNRNVAGKHRGVVRVLVDGILGAIDA